MDIEYKEFSDAYIRDIIRLFTSERILEFSSVRGSRYRNFLYRDFNPDFMKKLYKVSLDFSQEYLELPVIFYQLLPCKWIPENLINKDYYIPIVNMRSAVTDMVGDRLLRDFIASNYSVITPESFFIRVDYQDKKDSDDNTTYYIGPGIILDSNFNTLLSINFKINVETGDVDDILIKADTRVMNNSDKLCKNIKNRLLVFLSQNKIDIHLLLRGGDRIPICKTITPTIQIFEIGSAIDPITYYSRIQKVNIDKIAREKLKKSNIVL